MSVGAWQVAGTASTIHIRLADSRAARSNREARDAFLFRLRAGVPDALRVTEEILAALGAPPLVPAAWADAIRFAADRGALVFEEIRTRASIGGKPEQPQPVESVPRPQPKPKGSDVTFFEVDVVDEIGSPIGGVPLVYDVDGEAALTTDGAGHTRLDGVTSQFGQLRIDQLDALRDALRPRWDTVRPDPWLEPQPDHSFVALRQEPIERSILAETLHTVVIQPWVIRARLIGMFFDTNKSFLLPKGLAGIRGIVRLYADNPGAALLVVGHTDTTGDPSYNDPLSLERAEAVAAYLSDDVDHWLAWYGLTKSPEKRWGAKEDNDMLQSLPDHATKPPEESSVRWFQRTRSLTVDGIAGNQTRRALVTEYMAHDGTTLPADVRLTNHGAGENFPEFDDTSGDEEAKAGNRRVELYFFDGSMGVQPPPPGTISGPGTVEYPEWVRRAQETHDFELIRRERDCHFSFVLFDNLSEEPLPNEPFVLDIGEGESLQGETNGDGQLEFGDVPGGDYLLEIQGKKMFVPAISKQETLRPLLVRDDAFPV